MKRAWKMIGLLVTALSLGIAIHALNARGQTTEKTRESAPALTGRALAVTIVRAINTGEAVCGMNGGKKSHSAP